MVDKLVITKAPSEIIEQLRKEKLRMDGVKENNAKVLKELWASRQKAIESIKHFRKGLEIVLDHLENASLVEIETEYSAKEISVKNQLQISSHNIQRLEQAYKAMKIAEQLNKTQRFVNIKSAEKSLRTLEQIDQTESIEPQSVLNAFELNTNIYKYLKDLRSFSQIGTFKNEQTLLNEHKSTDINVEVSGESWSLIKGSCFTPDGVLLLSDQNGKLKRVDPRRGCVTDYYNLADGPWGVCCIGKDLAAVCLDNDTVQLISPSKKMTLLKELKFKHTCYGVASSESELFISDHAETVYIYDMAGKELGKLDCGNTYPIRLMAYDDTTSRLYIAAGDKMLTYDKLGSRMIIFKDPRINGITSVCTDKKGNAYLCGSLSNNVIRVGQDGRKIEEIVRSSDGIVNPLSVSWNLQNNKLCVTFPGTVIKIFDLQEY